jgi:hypothetical protein
MEFTWETLSKFLLQNRHCYRSSLDPYYDGDVPYVAIDGAITKTDFDEFIRSSNSRQKAETPQTDSAAPASPE